MKTLYTVLDVDPDASTTEINLAFSRAKLRYPAAKLESDENARIQFQAIAQAHATLVNDDSRAAYDLRLARAGLKSVNVAAVESDNHTARNFAIGAAVVLVVASMWFYHAREKARAQREIAAQVLKLAEEEQKRRAEEVERQAARTDADRARFAQREADNKAARERAALDRALQMQGARSDAAARQAQYDEQRREQSAASQARQADYEKTRREEAERNAARQAQMDAERRLMAEKRQLRETCMARYGKPDC